MAILPVLIIDPVFVIVPVLLMPELVVNVFETVKLVSVPRLVKLEAKTVDFNVVPVSVPASPVKDKTTFSPLEVKTVC
jgi:hypothetical protein